MDATFHRPGPPDADMPTEDRPGDAPSEPRRIVVLGATGSVGRATLDLVAAAPERYRVVGLSCHRDVKTVAEQARRFGVRNIAVTDWTAAAALTPGMFPRGTWVYTGPDAAAELAAEPEAEIVVAAIVGVAGLAGTWAAVEAGKRVALANKESLVVGGALVMEKARQTGAEVLPVDSEHSAIFQCLACGRREEVARVVLTASGGPFLRHAPERLATVTVAEALAHPTWAMGPKVTIDSATLMNKALELIEARWLFDLPARQLGVMIHPQSIIHSFVEYRDGSVIAQMGPPDMRLPIAVALAHPDRHETPAAKMDWTKAQTLELLPADGERYPALALGWEVIDAGGTSGAVVNAANEVAVAAFLDGRLPFTDIVRSCRAVLHQHTHDPHPTLESLRRADTWARQEMRRWIGSS